MYIRRYFNSTELNVLIQETKKPAPIKLEFGADTQNCTLRIILLFICLRWLHIYTKIKLPSLINHSKEQCRSSEADSSTVTQQLIPILWNLYVYYQVSDSLSLLPVLSYDYPVS
jgi:hypothetical protein